MSLNEWGIYNQRVLTANNDRYILLTLFFVSFKLTLWECPDKYETYSNTGNTINITLYKQIWFNKELIPYKYYVWINITQKVSSWS